MLKKGNLGKTRGIAGPERPGKLLTENLNDYIMCLNILLAKIFVQKTFLKEEYE